MDVPTREERTRTPGMQFGIGALIGFVIVMVAFLGITRAPYVVERIPSLAAVVASVLVELTNNDRTSSGLGTLAVSPVLTAVAEAKAADMAEKGYFAHVSPEGLTPWHWFKQEGYQFAYAGENLAIDFSESPDVVRAWMQSPTHRANILGTRFTEIGIAVRQGMYQGRPTTFVVQVFGTPAPAALAAARIPPAVPPATRSPDDIVDPDPADADPVREVIGSTDPAIPVIATTLPTSTPVSAELVLGQSVGSITASIEIPWWFKALQRLGVVQ